MTGTPNADTVVNVTIGRIDVRAVPAPAGERRADPAAGRGPKPLTLDEYFGRREATR